VAWGLRKRRSFLRKGSLPAELVLVPFIHCFWPSKWLPCPLLLLLLAKSLFMPGLKWSCFGYMGQSGSAAEGLPTWFCWESEEGGYFHFPPLHREEILSQVTHPVGRRISYDRSATELPGFCQRNKPNYILKKPLFGHFSALKIRVRLSVLWHYCDHTWI
jgi:hypothetical protein